MAKTITQKIVFKNIPVATLYNTYMNAKEHSVSVGVIAKIQNKEDAKFSAHDSYVTGKNLQLIKNKLIVQIGANQTVIQHSYFFLKKWVTMVSSTWYMQMFRINILQALRKAGTIITGNRGKNILLNKQKNKMPLSEPGKLVRL